MAEERTRDATLVSDGGPVQSGLVSGRRVAIPRGEIACPVAALRAWLDAAGITEGAPRWVGQKGAASPRCSREKGGDDRAKNSVRRVPPTGPAALPIGSR